MRYAARMSLWYRLWGSLVARRLPALRDLGETANHDRVRLDGTVEALQPVLCPVSGQPAVAVQYTAWPPSSTLGIDGGSGYHSRAFQVRCQQAADFVLCDGDTRVLVHVDPGSDVLRVHRELLDRHGIGLRSEQQLIAAGARVHVIGRVESTSRCSSPHRRDPYLAVVRAERFWLAE
jgi:hypothetical protein